MALWPGMSVAAPPLPPYTTYVLRMGSGGNNKKQAKKWNQMDPKRESIQENNRKGLYFFINFGGSNLLVATNNWQQTNETLHYTHSHMCTRVRVGGVGGSTKKIN